MAAPARKEAAIRLDRLLWVAACCVLFAGAAKAETCPAALAGEIPPRDSTAPSGTAFGYAVARASGQEREAAIAAELLAGNMPDFLQRLKPVTVKGMLPDGRTTSIMVCVTPDYLAIGSEADFLHVPMALGTALRVAGAFGFTLPTPKLVDAIYRQAPLHLEPQPLPASEAMRSTAYYKLHDALIAQQRRAIAEPLETLTAGHKKDLVLTRRSWSLPDRVAIYGWHRLDAWPIQTLSLVHGARYADYSHGVRLVSVVAYVDGRPCSVVDLLQDARLAPMLSDEGAIPNLPELLTVLSGEAAGRAMTRAATRLAETVRRQGVATR
jgi:hypothetical protein